MIITKTQTALLLIVAVLIAVGFFFLGNQNKDLSTPQPLVSSSQVLSGDYDPAQELGMETSWRQMPLDQQESLCNGWNAPGSHEVLLDSFLQGAPGFDRNLVRDFFNAHC